MKYFIIAVGLITILIVLGGIFFISKNEAQEPPPITKYEYFWGDGCPHCAKVAEYFDSTDKDEKAGIEKKEVWSNPQNAQLMALRAKSCNISPSEMGVPLLVKPDGSCLGGDQPIIDFFKSLTF